MDREYQSSNGRANRNAWEFEYTAARIAEGAKQQQVHRMGRVGAWEAKKQEVIEKIKESGLSVKESVAAQMSNYTTTKGRHGAQIQIDTSLQMDLDECVDKIRTHREAATEYDAWIQVLEANPESRLKLTHADWMFFFGK